MTNGKRDILIIMGRYLPGYKDGGPVRSIKNLTDYLGDEYNLKILTCDRDHGDTKPYPGVRINGWNHVGKANVYYVPEGGFTKKLIITLSQQADLVYVCGCFSDYSIQTLLANRFGRIKVPVVIAAMGLFSPLEFRRKYAKKKAFTTAFNTFGIFKKVYWSATSQMEIDEIKQEVRCPEDHFFIAEDLPRIVDDTPVNKEKKDGELKVVWISRIAPKKNLLGAIDILKQVKSKTTFTIFGPVHDDEYWEKCKKELKELPHNIAWEYKGNVASEDVVDTLKPYHVFLFPTMGENYGHVIQEALSAGCACILSNQTPWQDLEEKHVGRVFPVDAVEKYVQAIEEYAEESEERMQMIADSALLYAIENSNEKAKNTGYRTIFNQLSQTGGGYWKPDLIEILWNCYPTEVVA